ELTVGEDMAGRKVQDRALRVPDDVEQQLRPLHRAEVRVASGLQSSIAQLADQRRHVDLRRYRRQRHTAAPRVQLDGSGLVEADGNGQTSGYQGLFWQRQGDGFFVAYAILEASQDGARSEHQLQLVDRVQRVVALDGEEH